jgi:D-amino-acid dehydrogenase
MSHILIIGAGITGVTSAYALLKQGYQVTVVDLHRYAAMETSFANGGQLSACNAEVWNNWATVMKGLKWMTRKDAPLLLNPSPSLHKYRWLLEFIGQIPHYRDNTIHTAKLAIASRDHMFRIARDEGIDFDLVQKGILHVFHDKASFEEAERVNVLLTEGGLERFAVTPEEIRGIEPTLKPDFHGGFYTPADSTGDIHKFTTGLASACERLGARFRFGESVEKIDPADDRVIVTLATEDGEREALAPDALLICAGVGSRRLAAMVGDSVNIYPVKGYSITVCLNDEASREAAPTVSLLDEKAKIVTSRLGRDRFRVAGTAEYNGENRNIRADRIVPLVRWSQKLFPGMSTEQVIPWAGLRPMMPNMLPKIGPGRHARVFYNTGHGHLGWTLSAVTAELAADAVTAQIPA